MDYQSSLNAVCFGDLKQAALYFERVLPVAFLEMGGTGAGILVHAPEELPAEVFVSLVYGPDAPDHRILEYLGRHSQPFIMKVSNRLVPRSRPSQHLPYDEIQRLYLENHSTPKLGSIRDDFAEFSKSLGFEYSAVVLPALDEGKLSFDQAYAVVSLVGIPVVDVLKASWDQVLELREDQESARKLRRLRLLVYEKYVGKPKSYVEDDLAKRIEDYELARRKLGFESVASTISVILDAKTLQASIAAGLIGALFGGPAIAIGAAAAVDVGKISIELARKRQAIRDLDYGHDLAFLTTAKRHLR